MSDQIAQVASKPKRPGMGLGFWIPLAWLGLVVFAVVFAGMLPLPDPNETHVVERLSGPASGHLLGGDRLGHDELSRLISGASVSLQVGLASVGLGLFVGGTLGMIAGYFRGKVDALIMGVTDTVLAFPSLILALAIVAYAGQSLRNVVFAIAILAVPPLARVVRASTLAVAEREHVLAARMLGASHARILMREILPNVALPAASFGLIGVGVAMVAEGALSFLALSVPAPQATLGGMINEARQSLEEVPRIVFLPAGVMFLTVLSLNYVGDSLRRRVEGREGKI